MKDDRSRRELLRTATGVALGTTTLVGSTSARDSTEASESNVGPLQDAPYTVVTAEKSVFAPEVATIPAGATVEFRGNRYPHTITSTEALADVVTSSDCAEPYDGDDIDSRHGTRLDSLTWEHTVESADEPYNVTLESGGFTYVTYLEPGEYPYYCVPHCGSYMVGKLHVVEGEP